MDHQGSPSSIILSLKSHIFCFMDTGVFGDCLLGKVMASKGNSYIAWHLALTPHCGFIQIPSTLPPSLLFLLWVGTFYLPSCVLSTRHTGLTQTILPAVRSGLVNTALTLGSWFSGRYTWTRMLMKAWEQHGVKTRGLGFLSVFRNP